MINFIKGMAGILNKFLKKSSNIKKNLNFRCHNQLMMLVRTIVNK